MEKNVENQLDRKSLKSTSAGQNSRRKESTQQYTAEKNIGGWATYYDMMSAAQTIGGQNGRKRGRGRRKQRMIEDIMENEKYEGMKKERKIEPDGNGEDNNRRKTAQSCHQPTV